MENHTESQSREISAISMEDKGLKSFGLLLRKIDAFRACEVKKKSKLYTDQFREKRKEKVRKYNDLFNRK